VLAEQEGQSNFLKTQYSFWYIGNATERKMKNIAFLVFSLLMVNVLAVDPDLDDEEELDQHYDATVHVHLNGVNDAWWGGGNKDACHNKGGCSHICIKTPKGPEERRCACPEGYHMKNDGKTCEITCARLSTHRLDFDCWGPCGNHGGKCEKECGIGGYCCRKGHGDCPNKLANFADKKQGGLFGWGGHHHCVVCNNAPPVPPIQPEVLPPAPPAPPAPAPTAAPKCENKLDASKCAGYAAGGACKSKKSYMDANCAATCGLCGALAQASGALCADFNAQCGAYKSHGYCTNAHALFMEYTCRKACGKCIVH